MAEETRSSNATNVSVAEEQSYKILPSTPVWYQDTPIEMGDIGGEPVLTSPMPYREDQSMDYGRKVDVSASASYQVNINGENIFRLLQGFFVSNAVEQVSSHPINGNGDVISALTTSRITIAAGGDEFAAGDIIMISGATGVAAANNKRIGVVTGTPTATSITVAGTPFVAASSGLAGAKVHKVGEQFASGTMSMKVTGTTSTLEVTGSKDFTAAGNTFTIGQAIFIGGDDTATRFAATGLYGYARVIRVEAKKITFDNPTFTPVADSGTGKTIHVYFPSVLRNRQSDATRTRRTYTIERTLGEGETQGSRQAQYVVGAAPNALSLAFPLAALATANFSFMPARPEYEASALKSGTRIPAISFTDQFNTTSDLFMARVATNSLSLVPQTFFGFVSEFTLEQTNNISLNKAHGVEGSAAISYGDFGVTGSVTAYFKTVAPLEAIIGNERSQYHAYYAHNRHGFAIDVPLVSLSGGIPSFSKNQPITVPLSFSGAKSDSIGEGFGHVLMFSYFPYIPAIGEGRAK